MLSSPALPRPAALAGRWSLGRAGETCPLGLLVDDHALTADSLAGPMMAVDIGDGCPAGIEIRGWRPIPLGLELTGADGMAVMTFEQVGPEAFRSIDQVWNLTRP